ncbi:MAG: 5-formyltetrahydrofolate cyclo-ligase [Gammaproteobacteria bacterium]|nr:MAG: 5-formyltetrahydrofolate cyclo-ligase [Gammaproteobacteria bacterium]
MKAQNKYDIRQHMLARRRSLPEADCQALSHAVCQRFIQSVAVPDKARVALYWPVHGEVDTRPLIPFLQQKQCALYWPVIHASSPGEMRFAQCNRLHTMQPNRFGIPEPPIAWDDADEAPTLDIIITPLVAFDRRCQRLGMGGGYYDRLFEKNTKAKKIGVAYEFQYVETLPSEPWDQSLDQVVTEKQIHCAVSKIT